MTESSRAINFILTRRCGDQFRSPCSLGMRLGPIAVLSLAILIITNVGTAHAATIRDGDAFSISIEHPNARVCIIFPESARDPSACAGLTFLAKPPTTPGRRDLAIGLIRFDDRGRAATASVAVRFIPEFDSTEPDNAEAQALARGVERAYTRDNPGTKIRGGTPRVEIRVVAGLKMVRMVFDVDGLNGDDGQRTEHYIFYFISAEEGIYSFMLSTGGDHAAAIDAIADSSALTLRVFHPAQPSLLSRERRPIVAIVVWFMFAVGMIINLLWAYLHSERQFTSPTSLVNPPTWATSLNTKEFDVSAPARLRKPIRSAARAFKIIGLLSAFTVAGYLDRYLGFVVDFVCAVVVVWCSFLVSKRLRSGNALCAGLACIWCVAWAAVEVFHQLPKALRVNLDFPSVFFTSIGASLSVVPIIFLSRGLLAFRALRAYQRNPRNAGDPLARHPWEEGLYIRKHPRFVNKRSISGRFFVLLAPLPYLWVWATSNVSDTGDVPELIGQYIGVICIALGTLAWGALIYRRARKEAMLPGSELVKKDNRRIVLYIRSFHDDKKIKLRARATDGRILLERIIKITFEELITDHLWGYGPVLAIGDPGTRGGPAPLGAVRHFVTNESWQETATHLMQQASMILAIAAATPGFAWEIGMVVERGFIAKLVLLLPPLQGRELEARWQFLLSSAIGSSLPSQIDFLRARAVVFPGGRPVLITGKKRNDWTYEAVLDEAALVITNQWGPSPLAPTATLETKAELGGKSSILR